jgi:hypothetical protein
MADQQHPITPPPELVEQWWQATMPNIETSVKDQLCTQAARWGYEQRLNAVCEWLDYNYPAVNCAALRAAMHPKPPSLAEQALDAQERVWIGGATDADWVLIRAALRRLQELEKGNE